MYRSLRHGEMIHGSEEEKGGVEDFWDDVCNVLIDD
jgi:hypothetical protein